MLNFEQAVDGLIGSRRGQTNITSRVQGEAAAADTVALESFPQGVAKIIDDSCYMKN
jgi:hypothetical protein